MTGVGKPDRAGAGTTPPTLKRLPHAPHVTTAPRAVSSSCLGTPHLLQKTFMSRDEPFAERNPGRHCSELFAVSVEAVNVGP